MLPDIVTQEGGFLSPTQGYELNVRCRATDDKRELLFRWNNNTTIIYSGTEEECRQKMWDVIIGITNIIPKEEQANIITLGPEVPPEHYEPTECNLCKNKRKRIKKLEEKVEILEKHLKLAREQWNSGLETVTDAIQLLDSSTPSAVPQIAYVSEAVSLDINLAKQVDYWTTVDILENDEAGFVLLRTTADDLDGWRVIVKEENYLTHRLEFNFAGADGKVRYYRTGREEFLKGDTLIVVPKTIATKRIAIRELKNLVQGQEASE